MIANLCLFCQNKRNTSTVFLDTYFNGKLFKYKKCTNCKLIYLNPLPSLNDFVVMYPLSYQGEIDTKNYNHYEYIFNLIEKFNTNKKILDYGCGRGGFLIEANYRNYNCLGTEFNADLISSLSSAFTNISFLTIDNFQKYSEEKFDIIFLNNVLEHLINPIEIMEDLKKHLNPEGIFILQGPIEDNFNFGLLIRKIYFFIEKYFLGKKAKHAPTHIFHSNHKNQLTFFNSIKLKKLHYQIDEHPWPFPSINDSTKGIKNVFMYYVGQLSLVLKKLNKNWGNTYIYIGQPSDIKK